MSKVTHLLVCIVLTPCFNLLRTLLWFFCKFNFVLLRQRLVSLFLQEDHFLLYTSICLSIFSRSMFAFIPLFVDFVRYLTFWHHMIQIHRFSRMKSVDYFVCSICRYGIDQALFNQLKVKKIMQPAWFRQANFLLVEINNAKINESSREFREVARAPFPNSGW